MENIDLRKVDFLNAGVFFFEQFGVFFEICQPLRCVAAGFIFALSVNEGFNVGGDTSFERAVIEFTAGGI